MPGVSQIQKVLVKVIQNHKNGLCILTPPTGSGKSYAVKHILYDALLDSDDERKYICITSAKKNKLYDDLKKMCKDPTSQALFNELVIDVKANSDMIIDSLNPEHPENISEKIDDDELKRKYKKLVQEIQNDQILKRNGSSNGQNLNYAEREFRIAARKYLKQKYKNQKKENVLELLSEEKCEDHWLIDAFPSILIKQKKIIFMTVAKFIYPYDSIIETPFLFYEDKEFSESVFYIDEFDQAKISMLEQIINEDLNGINNGTINLLGLFDNILQLANRGIENLPEVFFHASESEKKKGYDDQKLREQLLRVTNIAKEISSDFNLSYELKAQNIEGENSDFLFHDTTTSLPIGETNDEVCIESNNAVKTNYIQKTGKTEIKLEYLLKRIEGFIRSFVRTCYSFAINIRENQNRRGNSFYELSDAIDSVISTLRINEPYSTFIHNQVLYGDFGQRRKDQENIGAGFYENGFSLFTIEDSSSHSMNSIVKMEAHPDTPEKVLLKMCRQGLVIGLSATGDIKSNIRNFDLPFIINELGDDFISIDDEDRRLIEEEYNRSTEKQKGIYQVGITKEYKKDTEIDCYKEMFADFPKGDEYARSYLEQVQNYAGDISKRNHFYNLLWAFDRFLFDDNTSSYLCLFNTYLEEDRDFVEKLLQGLIDIYEQNTQTGEWALAGKTVKDLFSILKSENFENDKEQLLHRLANGEKIFVLSAFQALATGQNLQYKAPEYLKENGKLVITNDRENNEWEKDFDGIFVEKPTNVLVNLTYAITLKKEDKIKAMYQAEELKQAGEISKTTMIKVLNQIVGGGKKYRESLYQTECVKNAEAITLIQSIGRIDRTNIKNRKVHVDIEYGAIDSFAYLVPNSDRMVAPVIRAVYDIVQSFKKKSEPSNESRKMELIASSKADDLGNNIYNLMNRNSPWTKETIEDWEAMNEKLLKDPQGLLETTDSKLFINLPEPSNKYYYKQTGDFRNNGIRFERPLFDMDCYEVSETGMRLDAIMSIPEIKMMFEEKGYATEFKPSNRMMAPVIANNLLKGRYGEVVGKYLVEKYGGIVLGKITDPNLYEKFDFHLSNYSVVVDFKNWSEKTRFDNNAYTEKMIKKAKECGSRLVLAINLISNNNYKPFEQIVDGINIKEIPNIIIREGDKYSINYDALMKIGEIIKEYI